MCQPGSPRHTGTGAREGCAQASAHTYVGPVRGCRHPRLHTADWPCDLGDTNPTGSAQRLGLPRALLAESCKVTHAGRMRLPHRRESKESKDWFCHFSFKSPDLNHAATVSTIPGAWSQLKEERRPLHPLGRAVPCVGPFLGGVSSAGPWSFCLKGPSPRRPAVSILPDASSRSFTGSGVPPAWHPALSLLPAQPHGGVPCLRGQPRDPLLWLLPRAPQKRAKVQIKGGGQPVSPEAGPQALAEGEGRQSGVGTFLCYFRGRQREAAWTPEPALPQRSASCCPWC